MNSRLDWLVLSDYYSICVTNAPPNNQPDSGFPGSADSYMSPEVGRRNARGS